jgi:hypothetical protein
MTFILKVVGKSNGHEIGFRGLFWVRKCSFCVQMHIKSIVMFNALDAGVPKVPPFPEGASSRSVMEY